jgi:hypothetical protein
LVGDSHAVVRGDADAAFAGHGDYGCSVVFEDGHCCLKMWWWMKEVEEAVLVATVVVGIGEEDAGGCGGFEPTADDGVVVLVDVVEGDGRQDGNKGSSY